MATKRKRSGTAARKTASEAISHANQRYLAVATGEQIEVGSNGQSSQLATSIRGVPHSITPRLVLALKSCRPENTKRNSLEKQRSEANAQGKALVNSLVKGGVDDSIKNTIESQKTLSQDASLDAVRSLFDLLRQEPSQVQVACASFLIDAAVHAKALDNSQVPWKGRRGALKLLWLLLQRSKACREYFCATGDAALPVDVKDRSGVINKVNLSSSSSPIRGMVSLLSSSVIDTRNDVSSTSSNSNHPLKFQHECVSMLHDLARRFGHIYPHLVVAVRYVEEKRGVVNVMNMVKQAAAPPTWHSAPAQHQSISNQAAAVSSREDSSRLTFRQNKAFTTRIGGGLSAEALVIGCKAAFKYGVTECRLVRNVIKDVESIMHIVHPNFLDKINDNGEEVIRHDAAQKEKAEKEEAKSELSNKVNINEDEEDDFDWEEGEEEGLSNEQPSQDKIFDRNLHEAEVERTLEAMGVSRDHSIVVNFGNASFHEPGNSLSRNVQSLGPSNSAQNDTPSTTVETKNGDIAFVSSSEDKNDAKQWGLEKFNTGLVDHKEDRLKIQDLVRQLNQRHLPTLELWLECVLINPIKSQGHERKKRHLLRIMLDTKREISDILSRASRMGYNSAASIFAEKQIKEGGRNILPSQPRRLHTNGAIQEPARLRHIAAKEKRQLKIKFNTNKLRIK